MRGRDIISVRDLSDAELRLILDTASRMEADGGRDLCEGNILATLFYEASTRTRLSFESAMHRLGGSVIGFADPETSSYKKGEVLADTARVVENYCDVIVMRHPLDGAAKVVADYAGVPFINAGDGGHFHPTQTLTDLYTLQKEKGRIQGLVVGLCGDLKYGRTVHSLAPALTRLGAKMYCIAPDSLKMPDAHLVEPREAGALLGETSDLGAVLPELDVLYVTRVQQERFDSVEEYEKVKGVYVVTPALLAQAKPDMLVMHPLPRVDEIAQDVDSDPRAAYFRQAANGVAVRMALIALLLGAVEAEVGSAEKPRIPRYRREAA
ncbi:MAG: aspartate carbamoyltransferase [Armatimonadota bacterium]